MPDQTDNRAALLAQVELLSAANLRVGNRLKFVRWLVEHGKLHEWPCRDCAGLGSYGTGAICGSCDGTGKVVKPDASDRLLDGPNVLQV